METIFVKVERCIGCRQCEFACAVEHSKSHDPFRAAWEEPKPSRRIFVEPGVEPLASLPIRCRHCDPAPCEGVCPTGALGREPKFGLVLLDGNKCIACAMCAMVCPFDVITFHPRDSAAPTRVVATKCDGCIERRARDEIPACVDTCKSGALSFGEINDLVGVSRREKGASHAYASSH